LIKNMTLSKYTLDYELNKRTRFPPEFDLQVRPGASSVTEKNKRKVLGDIFEAYVAGVILGDPQHGLPRVSSWMKALWSSELAEEIRKESTNHQLPATDGVPEQNPKVLLSQAIGVKGINIMYRDEGEPKNEKNSGLPWYTVGVYLDGWGVTNHRMGFGSGLSKREAGAKAAQAALSNRKMMKVFEQKRKDFVAAMERRQDNAH
jgi:ribonuclease-3